MILLLVVLPSSTYFSDEVLTKGIYAGNPYSMKTSRYFIVAFIKLSSCVQYCEYYFKSTSMFFRVYVYRYSTSIVFY